MLSARKFKVVLTTADYNPSPAKVFLSLVPFLEHFRKKGFCWQVKPLYHSDAFAQRFVLWEQPFRQLDLVCELKKRR